MVDLLSENTTLQLKIEDLQAEVKRLIDLIREYKSEYDNPVPDYMYRSNLRKRLFAAVEDQL